VTRVAAKAMFLAIASVLSTGAIAQEFSRFLKCEGSIVMPGKALPANADFALRFNNRTALIQRSNVLPVGERLNFVPTPAQYSMTYRLRPEGTKVIVIPGWFTHSILVINPDLRRLNEIRVSIDRQSGALEGIVLNEAQETLTTFDMACTSTSEQDVPAPKL
jgi:hypothetical protein